MNIFYIIKDDIGQYWDDEWGWSDSFDNAMHYSNIEHYLPIGGKWYLVQLEITEVK